jgi:hypothetical protein
MLNAGVGVPRKKPMGCQKKCVAGLRTKKRPADSPRVSDAFGMTE